MTHRDVGILASECYFPSTYVSQEELEAFDGKKPGHYVKGLGQEKMGFTGAGEDINSVMMNAVSNLLEKYNVDPAELGYLGVGTETLTDKSKSTKTSLMQLLPEEHRDLAGVTHLNACFGGTSALWEALCYLSSPFAEKGKKAVVVMGDIAVYAPGPARCTGGAGAVALLLGEDAPLVFDTVRSSYCEDAYDFYKPFQHTLPSEYPTVDGPLSNTCYLRAVDKCFQTYAKKFQHQYGEEFSVFGNTAATPQHVLFHQPYAKLVQKSFGRLLYNDLQRDVNITDPAMLSIASEFQGIAPEDTYTNRDLDKACVNASRERYERDVFPYTYAGRQLGNSYTGSLYFALLSLIAQSDRKEMKDDRVLMFSYGSGLMASMFSLKVKGSLKEQRETCDLENRLAKRKQVSPEEFSETLLEREQFHAATNFSVPEPPATLAPGSFYLSGIDDLSRRTYEKAPMAAAAANSVPLQAAASARGLHTSAHAKPYRFSSAQQTRFSKPLALLRRVARR
mmetsp:Transcript_4549/g.8008  ORF Transcript_4549/g.8008 Transcript_4549/m.8008 type:complete len:507 (+) Transcript_4549:185-1705(+)